MKRRDVLSVTVCLALLSSFFRKEPPLKLPVSNSTISSFYLGENYMNEVYFDLGINSFKKSELKDWDIRFQSSESGFGVLVNNGTNIVIRKIDIYRLAEPKSVDTLDFVKDNENLDLYDMPDGRIENSAIGDWRSYKIQNGTGIYIIKLGYKTGYQRFKRLQIHDFNDTAYFVTIADLFESDNKTQITKGDTITIKKDIKGNFTYYTFKNGGKGEVVMNMEPDKESWDIVFTKYKHIFYNILPNNKPFPYILSCGILLNPNKVCVCRDSTGSFDRLDQNSIPSLKFSNQWNIIGFDWKTHALGPGTYTITPGLCFIIKDTEGAFYKLRFLDFYNEQAKTGYPKFEYSRLK